MAKRRAKTTKPATEARKQEQEAVSKRRYKPPACPCCTSPDTGVKSSPKTTDWITRYLKCDRCNFTWSLVEKNTQENQ